MGPYGVAVGQAEVSTSLEGNYVSIRAGCTASTVPAAVRPRRHRKPIEWGRLRRIDPRGPSGRPDLLCGGAAAPGFALPGLPQDIELC